MFAAARTSLRTASRTVARRSYATAPLVVEAEPGQAAWWISAAVGVGALAFIFTQKDAAMTKVAAERAIEKAQRERESHA